MHRDDEQYDPEDEIEEFAIDDDQDVPYRLGSGQDSYDSAGVTATHERVAGPHEMPTMPIQREPGSEETLPDSGGLDPNPDFQPPASLPEVTQQTVVNAPKRTAPHVTQPPPPPAPIPPQQTHPRRPAAQQGRLARRWRKRRGFLGIPRGVWAVFGGLILTFCGGLTLITIVITTTLASRLENQLQEQIAGVDVSDNFQSTFFFDRNGQLLYEAFGEGRRRSVSLENIPTNLINATIATEDDTFYSNPGVDVPATIRAFLQFAGLREGDSGGSTITQQLVRNVIFDFEYRAERSIRRKGEEILLAMLLNRQKDKDEILEMYLNEIYYGNLAYGAEAAAQAFFNKSAGQLTLGEAALLAGLPQAPAELDPLNPDPVVQAAVEARWRGVLERMVETGHITTEERDAALRAGLSFSSPDVPLRAPHFTIYAQGELERLMRELGYTPDDITRGGLQVFTTVDLRINDLAQQAVRDQISRLAANNVSNGAVTVLQPTTGEIMAMIGSVDYNNDAIDGRVNVTTALRQPGSTMKPFTYSVAMEQGMTPGDVIWDTPTAIGIPGQPRYTPVNYDRRHHGPMRMRHALANSYNIPAVQTLRRIGVENLLEIMNRFGVETLGEDASVYGLSLTLGGGEVSLLELTNAYAVFARQGVFVEPTSILCVLDRDDDIIYQYEDGCPRGTLTDVSAQRRGLGRQVLDPRIAFIISDMLSDNVARTPAMGANSALNTGNLPAAVKTGTTDDVKDNWTMGYTRNVAVGVWVGNSNGDPMVNSSGLTGAAPIWNTIISNIYNNQDLLAAFALGGVIQPDQIQPPPGLTLRQMCDVRRMQDPATGCQGTISEWFLDSPAGLTQDDGTLYFPPGPGRLAAQPSADNPFLQELEPGVFRAVVQPIPPEVGNAIQFNVVAGQPQPPAPLYCQVSPELVQSTAGAQEQLFIGPPPIPEDAIEAEQYARNNGLAFLPTIACTPELLAAAVNTRPTVITALITQPTPGQVVTDPIAIMGTAQFSPEQAQFYKLEIIGGQFGGWTTLGQINGNSVVNGQLETLFAPALQPGNYQLRLAVIGHDGNFVQEPFTVPFTIQR